MVLRDAELLWTLILCTFLVGLVLWENELRQTPAASREFLLGSHDTRVLGTLERGRARVDLEYCASS